MFLFRFLIGYVIMLNILVVSINAVRGNWFGIMVGSIGGALGLATLTVKELQE